MKDLTELVANYEWYLDIPRDPLENEDKALVRVLKTMAIQQEQLINYVLRQQEDFLELARVTEGLQQEVIRLRALADENASYKETVRLLTVGHGIES